MRALAYLFVFLGAILVSAPAMAETWHRADTHHFRIYSDGKKRDLEDFAHELEKFDALLRILWKKQPEETPSKLDVYMVSSASDVAKILGRKNIAGFYVPNMEGSFAVSNRQYGSNKSTLSGRRTLYHEYAHHFLYKNFAIPAPSWFIEGFAEFVSTVEFKKNGDWYFGKPAFHRAAEIEYGPKLPIKTLLTASPRQVRGARGSSFYGWSWALTHMLYSKEYGRGNRIDRYLKLANSGIEPLQAAQQAFGDLDTLQSNLRSYVDGRMSFNKSDRPIAYREVVSTVTLSEAESEIIGLKLRRMGGAKLEETRDDLKTLTQSPLTSAEAWYQLARAEYTLADRAADRSEEDINPDYSAVHAAVDSSLGMDANHVHANVLKGKLLIEALDQEGMVDEEQWKAARAYLLTANKANPYDPFVLHNFARSYTLEGTQNTQVSAAIETAFDLAPEVKDLRVAYAFDQASNQNYGRAISLLKIIANDPHGGSFGREAIKRIEAMMSGNIGSLITTEVATIGEDDDDGDEDLDDDS